MRKIAVLLDGGELDQLDEYIDNLNPTELEAFKYTPAVSCDVERSLSQYKSVLNDTRRSFTFDNLRVHVIMYCNPFK